MSEAQTIEADSLEDAVADWADLHIEANIEKYANQKERNGATIYTVSFFVMPENGDISNPEECFQLQMVVRMALQVLIVEEEDLDDEGFAEVLGLT